MSGAVPSFSTAHLPWRVKKPPRGAFYGRQAAKWKELRTFIALNEQWQLKLHGVSLDQRR
jgi:hypothetical protein